MGSGSDEDSPKGGDAIWGPLLKIRLSLILTNRASTLMRYFVEPPASIAFHAIISSSYR
jgi:hypothetical protein